MSSISLTDYILIDSFTCPTKFPSSGSAVIADIAGGAPAASWPTCSTSINTERRKYKSLVSSQVPVKCVLEQLTVARAVSC